MNINDLCINCFNPHGGQEVCMHCGFVQYSKPRQVCHLHPHTILNNKYVIGKVLNNGGLGVVYKAFDLNIGQIVAIKELLPTQNSLVTRIPGTTEVISVSPAHEQEFQYMKQQFNYEASRIYNLQSDSVVRVKEFFEENNTAYMVMEFLDGITLKNYIDDVVKGPVSVNEAFEIMLPIMDAVKNAHQNNVIHNDISPDNIIISPSKTVKLIDFGSASFDKQQNTSSKFVIKPGFTPIEQYKSNSEIGEYTDIYSVGALWYYLLTGSIPTESIDRVEKDILVKPSKINPEIPAVLDKSIMKAMAVREGARFNDMDDFILAVQGKKKAEFPEIELKRKKLRRAVSFVAVIVLLATSVIATYKVTNLFSIATTGDADITIWVVEDESNKDGQKEYWKRITDSFNKSYENDEGEDKDNITIDYEIKSKDTYAKDLADAKQNGNMPDIYQSVYIDTSVLEKDLEYSDADKSIGIDKSYSESMYSLYRFIDKENTLELTPQFGEVKEVLDEENQFAASYDMPILYINTEKKKDFDKLTNEDLEKHTAINPVALEYVEKQCNFTRAELEAAENNSAKDFASKKKKDIYYYIGFVSDYKTIYDKFNNSNSIDIKPLSDKNTPAIISEAWSISKYSSKNDKNAAKLFLYDYLLKADGTRITSTYSGDYKYISLNQKFSKGNDILGSFNSKAKEENVKFYDTIKDIDVVTLSSDGEKPAASDKKADKK